MSEQATTPAASAETTQADPNSAVSVTTANAETPEPSEAADTGATETATSDGQPAADENAANERRNKVPAKDRIQQLVQQNKAKDAQIARLQSEHAALTQQAQPVGDPLDYATDAEYHQALASSVAAATEARAVERTARQIASERQEQTVTIWNERCDDFRAVAPDFDAVVFNDNLTVPAKVTELVLSVENGPAVAYFLGKNPNEIARIARLSERDAAIAIGQLSNRVTLPASKRATGAPPPVTTVSGSGNASSVDPAKLNNRDYRAWRNKQSANRS